MSCIATTLEDVGLRVHPYVVEVPSFGLWGFVLATREGITPHTLDLPIPTRYLTQSKLKHLFELPKDVEIKKVAVNRLADPVIVRYQSDPRWNAY
jgi:spermidine synthase